MRRLIVSPPPGYCSSYLSNKTNPAGIYRRYNWNNSITKLLFVFSPPYYHGIPISYHLLPIYHARRFRISVYTVGQFFFFFPDRFPRGARFKTALGGAFSYWRLKLEFFESSNLAVCQFLNAYRRCSYQATMQQCLIM